MDDLALALSGTVQETLKVDDGEANFRQLTHSRQLIIAQPLHWRDGF